MDARGHLRHHRREWRAYRVVVYELVVRRFILTRPDVPDELGVHIDHSREPNVVSVPFLYLDQNISYDIVWPIAKISECDEVLRDMTHGTHLISSPFFSYNNNVLGFKGDRDALSLAWDMDEDDEQTAIREADEHMLTLAVRNKERLDSRCSSQDIKGIFPGGRPYHLANNRLFQSLMFTEANAWHSTLLQSVFIDVYAHYRQDGK